MPDFLLPVIQNTLWAKWVVALVLFLYIRKIGDKPNIPVFREFTFIFWVLLSTDLVFSFFSTLVAIPLLQNILLAVAYLRILSNYTKVRYDKVAFWVLNTLGFAFAVVSYVLKFPWFVQFVFGLQIVLNWVFVGVKYYDVSEFNTEKAGVVMSARSTLVQMIIVVQGIMLLLVPFGGYQNTIIQTTLIPIGYIIHPWVLSFWEKNIEVEQAKYQGTLEKNLNTMFEFMITIGNAISEKLEMDKVLDFVVKSAVKASGADGGAVFLVDDFDDVLRVKAVEGDFPPPYQVPSKVKLKISNLANFFKSTPIPVGKTIVGECATAGVGIYIRDTREDPRMAQNAQMDQIYIASIILMPLMQEKKVFGVLAVVSKRDNYLFTEDQFNQIKTFGDYTSLTINSLFTYLQLLEKQEMEREVGIAAEIQGQLLPSKLPRVSSVSLAAYSLPAKGVSGDYYDVINIRKGQVLLAVCDVAGKGIPASLVMVMIRTIIHLVAHQPNMTVSRILDIVNWGIAGKVSLDRFATVAMLSYDFAKHTLEYSNAAHHPLLIYRSETKSFEALDTEGIPIGLEKKTKYNQINTKLGINDIIVLYTDGIIEAMTEQGVQYSLESLQRVILENAELSPEKLKKRIIEDVNAFVGKAKQHDDQTFLLMKVEN